MKWYKYGKEACLIACISVYYKLFQIPWLGKHFSLICQICWIQKFEISQDFISATVSLVFLLSGTCQMKNFSIKRP